MDGKNLTQIILTAVSYYLFSSEFFIFSAEIKNIKTPYRSRFVCFFVVYLWFMIASYLELPLIVNWFIFFIILGLEVHIVFSFDYVVSCGLSLFCIIMGLAVNVLFRNLTAMLLNMPISAFDNQNLESSLKYYPILLGFLVMALLFYVIRRVHFAPKLELMLHYRKSLNFYTCTEIFIYLFLMVQLLAYSQSGNEMGIKVWGIKSALFSIIVLAVTIVYTLRVASLHYYMDKQFEIRSRLIREKQDINKLWKLAYTDMLTGLSNRQLLEKRLKEYAGYGSYITLAFLDVNGLKTTNDQYGHMEGDAYLTSVSQILSRITCGLNLDLFRYGGDEFVIMSNTLSEKEITDLLITTNDALQRETSPYPRSISYGVIRGDCTKYQELIDIADERMYQHKMAHYETMARS